MTSFGKYSRIERERRFLLQPDVIEEIIALPKKIITDHYLVGTHLRLRKMTDDEGYLYKLAKKSSLSPGKEEITTIYLSVEEYNLLSNLPAIVLKKVRFLETYDQFIMAIDIYGDESDGLVIAEIEFETDEEMNSFVMPRAYQTEVTGNEEFAGFTLAKHFGFRNQHI